MEVFAHVEDDEPLTLDPEEKRAIRKRLERANELEKENRELREKLPRLEEELRRPRPPPRSSPPVTSPPRREVPLQPSVLPVGQLVSESLVRPGARRATQGTRASGPIPSSPPLRLRWSGVEVWHPARRAVRGPSENDTDLPPPEPRIFDAEISRYTCPGCHRRVEPQRPYPRNRPFGSPRCLGWSTFACSG